VSRKSDAKKARRRKRQASRDQVWIPARVADELDVAVELEGFDARLVDRGWTFSEDAEDTDEEAGVAWFWPPSQSEVDNEDEQATATVILLTPDDGGEIAHVVFVGTSEDYQFGLDELFDHIEVIEAYRFGSPLPVFG
jgi:hypothetical protein